MLKKILQKVFLFLSYPVRLAVRCEVLNTAHVQDIERASYRRATESTADYVIKHMIKVNSVSSSMELLTMAIGKADLGKNNIVLEFGVYSGATINHIASLTTQPIYGFDSFEGLPEQWRDRIGKGYFKVDALPKVPSNVSLIKGWFDATLPAFIKEHEEPIGFIHVDCDLYSSTKTIFDLLGKRIQPGCVIVFDEYFNYPGWEQGEHKAFQEFIKQTGFAYEYVGYNRRHEQVAVKIKS
jgi:predicted O-methyltransferase YrrM